METTATAQLSTHQSAGDVIGSGTAAGLMCWGGSMAQQSTLRTIHRHHPYLQPPLGAAGSLSLHVLMT